MQYAGAPQKTIHLQYIPGPQSAEVSHSCGHVQVVVPVVVLVPVLVVVVVVPVLPFVVVVSVPPAPEPPVPGLPTAPVHARTPTEAKKRTASPRRMLTLEAGSAPAE
jgi:hypothetical protein